jgi:uroporphyrinogen-III synthase
MTSLLKNKIFISTRPKNSSGELAKFLAQEGATLLEFPLIEIKTLPLYEDEKAFFYRLEKFQWIIFTSPNGVTHFFENLKTLTGSTYLPETLRIGVIGEKTERIVQSFGYAASFVNPGSTADDFSGPFYRSIQNTPTRPNILLPLGNLARTIIQEQLKDVANCTRINVYKTEIPENFDENIVRQIKKDQYDMLIFTSPSGIRNFVQVLPASRGKNIRMACIGPVTYREARENGFKPLVVAEISSAAGIVDSILNYYISET